MDQLVQPDDIIVQALDHGLLVLMLLPQYANLFLQGNQVRGRFRRGGGRCREGTLRALLAFHPG